jgi:hypothetical protein
MKPKSDAEFAAWLKTLVEQEFEKDATKEERTAILLRLTPPEKASVEAAAKSVGLTVTGYLLRCHALISTRLPKR